jgi:hypothetical protein
MMAPPRVECDVVFASDDLRVGECANAFRVMADSVNEVLLDFCVYSEMANVAKVVSRVRIPKDFLSLVDARIQEAIAEFAAEAASGHAASMRKGILAGAGGSVILFGPKVDGDN